MDQEKKDKSKKTLLVMAVIFAVFIVATLIFWEILKYSIFVKTFNYVVQNIIDVSGMSHWLAKGIVILACIPFFFALIEVLKLRVKLNIFKKKPVRSYRKIAFFVIIAYIAGYFFCMFLMSKNTYFAHSGSDLKPTKFYAITPEGFKFYDTPGRDPKYGKELKPVTPDMIEKYERAKLGKKPKKVFVNQETEYFDSITGEPKLWYFIDPTGNYEFYDQPGFQSVYFDELKPVTRKAIFDYMESLKKQSEAREIIEKAAAASAEKAKEEKIRKDEETAALAEKAKAEEIKKKKETAVLAEKAKEEKIKKDEETIRNKYIDSNIDTALSNMADKKEVAVLIIDSDKKIGTAFTGPLNEQMAESLNNVQTKGIIGFFNEGFIANGNFEKVYKGKRDIVLDLGLEKYVDYILLGKDSEEYSQNANLGDLYSCKIDLGIKIIFAKSGEILSSSTFQAAGVGINKEKAAIQARQRIAEKSKSYILSIIHKNNRP